MMSKFVPNEIITIDDRGPPWLNHKIKSLIKNKTEYFKNYVDPNNAVSLRHFEQMHDALGKNIDIFKQKHYSKFSRKLVYYKINPKFYWFILKRFLNNKKIPCIPPSIHNNQFAIDFKGKSKLFNSFFAKQCTNIETRSNLPTQILRRTNKCLNTINFTKDDILRVISKLNPDKGHGHDQISISIIQICDKAIYKPLNFIYSSWIKSGIFPNNEKRPLCYLFKNGITNRMLKIIDLFYFFQFS